MPQSVSVGQVAASKFSPSGMGGEPSGAWSSSGLSPFSIEGVSEEADSVSVSCWSGTCGPGMVSMVEGRGLPSVVAWWRTWSMKVCAALSASSPYCDPRWWARRVACTRISCGSSRVSGPMLWEYQCEASERIWTSICAGSTTCSSTSASQSLSRVA